MKRSRFPRTPEQRRPVLVARQKLKMARSANAYVRGNTLKFYEWLERAKGGSIPEAPPVWICGDCHVGNLGPVADAEGRVAVQHLDQTVIGNPAHDLIRLGLSLAMAARSSDLPGVTTALLIEQMVAGYEKALAGRLDEMPDAVRLVVKRALKRGWKRLLADSVEDTRPAIPRGPRFWELSKAERRTVDNTFAAEDVRRMVTSLRCREDKAAVEVVDAAYWVKGCSSLGRLRLAVLARVESSSLKRGRLCLVDIKEAAPALAPRYGAAEMPSTNGDRIVVGARHLAPFLGERMLATKFLGRSVFLRELLPQDLKFALEHLSRSEATAVARYLASVVGRAHARQLSEKTRTKWKVALGRHRPKSLEAPSWLWASVVELVADHEAGYLEHCRRYALETSRDRAS